MKNQIQRFITSRPGFESAMVEELGRMPGGASKETWSCDVRLGDEILPLVLRINRDFPLPIALDLEPEFILMKAAHAQGIPVPRPYWFGRLDGGAPFYAIARIEGETIVRKLHREPVYKTARQVMPAQLGRALAGIHRVPLAGDLDRHLPARTENGSAALGELAFIEKILRNYSPDPHPALELAFRWLRQNVPAPGGRTLIHGDYRLGNVIFSDQGLVSILDWELSHIGDPFEDLGYISIQAWRFGRDELPIGGIGQRKDFLQAYQEAGGSLPDPEALRWWEVFGNVKWAVITVLQMVPFLDGSSRSIELASLGRKTAEVELQILTLIEKD
ncbi:MAG: phosphotransferase family protein [Proteobacteria bacterium]|nr:phosphotransferase family protein [Pseudomonadota bacterium]